jgi:RimJ/RimL family protein N-acetyltransferase
VIELPLPLETGRLRLRHLGAGDRAAVHAIESREDLARWLNFEPRIHVSLTVEPHRQGEIGFIFHPDHQGRGYATEAGRAVLAMAFETYGLHRVFGRLEARNRASARVLEKLGLRREAYLVENEWVKGEWQSELVYAVLAREWRSV